MKKQYQYLAACVAAASIMVISASAGSAYAKQATLNYRGITVYVNGEKQILTDANGNIVEPFIIDGTTYLPVRAISQALGMGVEWYGETNTITIGTTSAQTPAPTQKPAPTSTPASVSAEYQNRLIMRIDTCIRNAGYQAEVAQNAINDAISRGMGRSSFAEQKRAELAVAESDIAGMQSLKISVRGASSNDELERCEVEIERYEQAY